MARQPLEKRLCLTCNKVTTHYVCSCGCGANACKPCVKAGRTRVG
jgi:hypothetical protein